MILFDTLNRSANTDRSEEAFSIAAVIDSALCVGAGGSSGSLADKPILKTAEGQLVIPASQLKGRLRHECEKFARGLGWPICESPVAERMCPQRAKPPGESATETSPYERAFECEQYKLKEIPGHTHHPEQYHCLICQIFGNPSLPARLLLSDLICTELADDTPDVLRPGVTLNRRRRTAEEKKLYFLETSPANAALRFEGTLTLSPAWPLHSDETVRFANLPRRDFAIALIKAGLKHVIALGGSKSAGLGWLRWDLPDSMSASAAEWTFLGGARTDAASNGPGGSQ